MAISAMNYLLNINIFHKSHQYYKKIYWQQSPPIVSQLKHMHKHKLRGEMVVLLNKSQQNFQYKY